MSTEDNKELVRQYLAAFNDRDRDTLSEVLAEDVVEHGVSDELHGLEEIMGFLETHFEIFPDYTGTTEAMVAEGDTVVVRYTVSGTHTGEYQGIEPTGHTVEWTGVGIYRIEDGGIAEIWLEEDRLGLLEGLEVVERPAHLRI
ncbi:MAG: ester cyclase [Haloarculaceae archaeon]